MRNILVMSIVVLAAGCGGLDSKAWDKNHDGLVGQCEGLDRFFCGLTPGCEGHELACIALCRDDGKGGCGSPCPDDYECVPKVQPACRDLNAQQCASDSRCIANTEVCSLVCIDDGKGGCVPCNGGSSCVDRHPQPTSCAIVPIGSCASIPQCEVQTVTACAVGSGGSGHTGTGAPASGCGGGGGCTSTQVCVNKPVNSCESTPVGSCTANPACALQSGPTCKLACQVGAPCPPCATAQLFCVTRPPASCESRSLDQCTRDAGCEIGSYACAQVCQPDGKGGCLPCAPHCVSAPQPAPPTK